MKNNYKLIVNCNEIAKRRCFDEGFEVAVEDEDVVFLKKDNGAEVRLDAEKQILEFGIAMMKKYNFSRTKIMDLTSEINLLLERVGDSEIDFKTDRNIPWMFRQIATGMIAGD